MGLKFEWDGDLKESLVWAKDVSQVDGDSDMAPACVCSLNVGRAQQKNNGFLQQFCLGESCPSSSCLEARQFSSSSYVSGTFTAVALSLELRAGESVRE